MANWYRELKDKGIVFCVARKKPDYGERENTPAVCGTLEECRKVMDVEFDDFFGGTNGAHFTAWSKDRVYFPVQYDGFEWMESVPRFFDSEEDRTPMAHIGGG